MSQQINLLSSDLRQRRELLAANKVAVAALALLLLVAAAAAWNGNDARLRERRSQELQSRLQAAKDQLAALSKDLAARQRDDKLLAELLAASSQLKGREELMAYLESAGLGSSQGFAQFLRAFARQTPNGLWLTGFTLSEGGREMEIHGRMLQPASLPEYIRRLNGETTFHGRSFASLDIRRTDFDKAKPTVASAAAQPKYVEFALTSSAPNVVAAASDRPAELRP